MVLWLGWHSYPPELLNLGDKIIYAEPATSEPPKTAEIYVWTRREYKLAKTVPWRERYSE